MNIKKKKNLKKTHKKEKSISSPSFKGSQIY